MILRFPIKRSINELGVTHSENKRARTGQRLIAAGSITQNLTAGHAKTPSVKVYKMLDSTAPIVRQKSKFKIIKFNQTSNLDDPDWLIEGLLKANSIAVYYGKQKDGKSFVALDTGLHVALGWDYRGKPLIKGGVVYVACEGASGIISRIEAFKAAKLKNQDLDIPFFLCPDGIDLIKDHKQLADDIRITADVQPIDLIIIDTVNRSLFGSENSDVDMGNYIKAADYLRGYFSCCVLLVHHCGHDTSRPRGHTSLTAAVDTLVSVKKNGNTITSKVEMMKDAEAGEVWTSTLEPIGDSCVLSHGFNKKQIELEVSRCLEGGTSIRDTANKFNLNKNQILRIKKAHSVPPKHPSKEGMLNGVGIEL